MNKEDPYRDQAEKLRKKIDRNFDNSKEVEKAQLPPRSSVHNQKQKKNKWKLKYPIIRLLVLFFILLPITILSIYSAVTKGNLGNSEKTTGETEGFEIIDYENTDLIDRESNEVQEKKGKNAENTVPEEIEPTDTLDGQEQKNTQDTQQEPLEGASAEPEMQQQTINASFQPMNKETQVSSNVSVTSPKGNSEQKQKRYLYHEVQKGETLFSISMKYFHSQKGMEILRSANGLTGEDIQIGQILRIPLKD